jgi:hypothetical protein
MSKKIIIFQKLNIDIILFCCKASFEYNQYTDANLMQSKKKIVANSRILTSE